MVAQHVDSKSLSNSRAVAASSLLRHFTDAKNTAAEVGTALLTYQSRQLSAPEAHADAHVEAVGVGEALVALRHCDVDGGGQEDGHVHRDDGPGPGAEGWGMTQC